MTKLKVTPEIAAALPLGSKVRDEEGDVLVKVKPNHWSWCAYSDGEARYYLNDMAIWLDSQITNHILVYRPDDLVDDIIDKQDLVTYANSKWNTYTIGGVTYLKRDDLLKHFASKKTIRVTFEVSVDQASRTDLLDDLVALVNPEDVTIEEVS